MTVLCVICATVFQRSEKRLVRIKNVPRILQIIQYYIYGAGNAVILCFSIFLWCLYSCKALSLSWCVPCLFMRTRWRLLFARHSFRTSLISSFHQYTPFLPLKYLLFFLNTWLQVTVTLSVNVSLFRLLQASISSMILLWKFVSKLLMVSVVVRQTPHAIPLLLFIVRIDFLLCISNLYTMIWCDRNVSCSTTIHSLMFPTRHSEHKVRSMYDFWLYLRKQIYLPHATRLGPLDKPTPPKLFSFHFLFATSIPKTLHWSSLLRLRVYCAASHLDLVHLGIRGTSAYQCLVNCNNCILQTLLFPSMQTHLPFLYLILEGFCYALLLSHHFCGLYASPGITPLVYLVHWGW